MPSSEHSRQAQQVNFNIIHPLCLRPNDRKASVFVESLCAAVGRFGLHQHHPVPVCFRGRDCAFDQSCSHAHTTVGSEDNDAGQFHRVF